MFEHLDDPMPYAPPPGLRTAVRARVRHRRRRRLAVAGGVASVGVLGLGAVAGVRSRLEPERMEVTGLAGVVDGPVAVRGADPVHEGDPATVLVVGVDGVEQGPFADSIALVRIDPAAGEVRLLSVPRDLVLPTEDGEVRATVAIATGGPGRLVQAVDQALGTPIDHYVQVDMTGAVDLVDALGGVRLAVDRPIRDDGTGTVLGAGCQTLDGRATLELGRARQVEVRQDDGAWVDDPSGTLGREARGSVVAAALLQAAGRVEVGDLPALVRTGLGSIAVDDSLETRDLERWARDTRDHRFVPLGLPVVGDLLDDADVLRLDDGAAAVVAAFLDGGTDPVPAVADGAPVVEAAGLRPC